MKAKPIKNLRDSALSLNVSALGLAKTTRKYIADAEDEGLTGIGDDMNMALYLIEEAADALDKAARSLDRAGKSVKDGKA